MYEYLCKDLKNLFPEASRQFPQVRDILKTSDDYSVGFYSNNPKQYSIELIRGGFLPSLGINHWKDQIVLDLGCGRGTSVYGAVCISGAKAYVPVDKFHMPRWLNKFIIGEGWESPLKDYEKERGLSVNRVPVYPVYGDMCNLIEKLPNDSVGILIAGIDRVIINEKETFDGKNCLETLLKEIPRILSSESACISFMSFLDFKELKVINNYGSDLKVYKK